MFSNDIISWGCILQVGINEDVFIDEDKLERFSGYNLLNFSKGVSFFVLEIVGYITYYLGIYQFIFVVI